MTLVSEQERPYNTYHKVSMAKELLNLRLKTQPQFLGAKRFTQHLPSKFPSPIHHTMITSITLSDICKGNNICGKLKFLASVPHCSCNVEERTKCANISEFQVFPYAVHEVFQSAYRPLRSFRFGLTAHTNLLTLHFFLGSFEVA